MPEFLHLLAPDEARNLLLENLSPLSKASESIKTVEALGCVTAEDIRAPHPLPAFPRSTMDGYAVRAKDTFGASDSLPLYLSLIGEVPMGIAPDFKLEAGQAALIHTGGMLPEGSNAVLMLEHAQSPRSGEIEALRAVADGENVLRVGEDVIQGVVILSRGSCIRPAEIGGLMALGIVELRVVRKIKVGLISTGDEVVPPEQSPQPGRVRDINSYSLAALVKQAGGDPVLYGIIPDRLDSLEATAARALTACDVVVITAGSSASSRDMTAGVIGELGSPGVLVHGINTRPGKPTILGVCNGKAVIGLPGNPVSALVNGYLFVLPVIDKLLEKVHSASSEGTFGLHTSIQARLAVNVSSQAGREDWIPVRLIHSTETTGSGVAKSVGLIAQPIFGKSNLIFSLVAADGLVRIPPDATGISADEVVDVFLM
jgi:molybdopterin molybdotransferase